MIAKHNLEQRIFYTPKDVHKLLGCSLSKAYAIFYDENFPSFKIGGTQLVENHDFERWINEQKGRDLNEHL
jgi:predicted DNA-binding transcriptional regulator AlpA